MDLIKENRIKLFSTFGGGRNGREKREWKFYF
jgi:hypothetical protein